MATTMSTVPIITSTTALVARNPSPMAARMPSNVPATRCAPLPKAPSISGWMMASMVMRSQAPARPGQIASVAHAAIPVAIPAIRA